MDWLSILTINFRIKELHATLKKQKKKLLKLYNFRFVSILLLILLNESFDYPHFIQQHKTVLDEERKIIVIANFYKENTKWSHIISYLSQTVYLAFFLWISAVVVNVTNEHVIWNWSEGNWNLLFGCWVGKIARHCERAKKSV